MNTNDHGASSGSSLSLPDLPRAITSFGAAALNDALYIYGGHHAKAHHYFREGQSGQLWRLDLNDPQAWRVASEGPRLQGLALAAHNGGLLRVGGFTAKNEEDQAPDLQSVADLARYDVQRDQWRELPPMPTPRSSMDAAVLGDTLYVVGGWALSGNRGESDAQHGDWESTACAIDLSDDSPGWRLLPPPPFQRRALAVGACRGKIYVIGGMQSDGQVTPRTAVYDPASQSWSEGPALPGGEMIGFGAACCSLSEKLYVSGSERRLLRLADDGRSWQGDAALNSGRFFHRMLPLDDRRLVLLGGTAMRRGRFSACEIVTVEDAGGGE